MTALSLREYRAKLRETLESPTTGLKFKIRVLTSTIDYLSLAENHKIWAPEFKDLPDIEKTRRFDNMLHEVLPKYVLEPKIVVDTEPKDDELGFDELVEEDKVLLSNAILKLMTAGKEKAAFFRGLTSQQGGSSSGEDVRSTPQPDSRSKRRTQPA